MTNSDPDPVLSFIVPLAVISGAVCIGIVVTGELHLIRTAIEANTEAVQRLYSPTHA